MTQRIRPPSAKRLFRFVARSRSDIHGDVNDEFAFHIDMRVEDLVKCGRSHSDARAQALREFGSYTNGTRACAREGTHMERQRTMTRLVSEFRQDAKFGARLLSRSPGFSLVAILTLGLSIGGNTAIFSIVNGFALKPLPARNPAEIVRIYTAESMTSWPNYQDIAARSEVFTDVAAHTGTTRALATGDNPSRLGGETTSVNYLAMLGVPAQLGRVYLPSDARADIVVLSERTWRTRFASDPSIVGRTVMLNGRPFEVLGVMPRGFRGARPAGFSADFWVPIDVPKMGSMMQDRGKVAFQIAARLEPDIDAEQAQAATLIVTQQLGREYPELAERFSRTEVFRIDGVAGFRGVTRTLAPVFAFIGLLTIVAGLVLLVGCANIAGLMLGRGAARRREIGVRLALGAGRSRLVRQLLTESLLLALLGGALGILLAIWLTGSLSSFSGNMSLPIELDLSLDRRVLGYTLVLSLMTSLLCGLAPARRATRMAVVPALKDHTPMPERQRLRHWLVVGQVGISCALLVWGGLFLRSLSNAHDVDIGMDPNGVLIARLEFEEESARSGAIAPRLRGLHERIEAVPGVETQGLAKIVPLALSGREEMRMRTESDSRDQPGRWVLVNRVGPGWFSTVRIPVLVGRDFTFDDRAGAPRVAVVNETAARQFWNGDALSKRINDAEVIGIVADSKYWSLGEEIRPTVYTAYYQRPEREITIFLRASNLAAAAKALRADLTRLDPTLYADIKPMTDALSPALVPAQVGAAVTSGFGALGAILAMMGIYGLVTFTVAQRTREIGIRKAVGATTRDIVRLIVSGTARPVMIGLLGGLGLGILGALGLSGFVVGVSPIDPVTLAGTTVLVVGTTLLASIVPALRAARVDPLRTLKAE
jgi:predicted permease